MPTLTISRRLQRIRTATPSLHGQSSKTLLITMLQILALFISLPLISLRLISRPLSTLLNMQRLIIRISLQTSTPLIKCSARLRRSTERQPPRFMTVGLRLNLFSKIQAVYIMNLRDTRSVHTLTLPSSPRLTDIRSF